MTPASPVTAPTRVALLRGINVGGRARVPMEELRTLCAQLGWEEVRTYVQSGNVVFRSGAEPARLEESLEAALDSHLGVRVPVMVRAGEAWRSYLPANPFPDAAASQPNLLMLALSKRPPAADAAERLQERAADGERVARTGDVLWIHFPGGAGRSRLSPSLLDRFVGSPVTLRNWRTATALAELAAG